MTVRQHQPLSAAITLIMFAALSTAGCDKTANIASEIAAEIAAPVTWEFTDQTDPMTGKRVVTASWNERIDAAAPLVIGKTDVVCDNRLENGKLYIEITTYDPRTEKDGYVDAMPMQVDELASEMVAGIAGAVAYQQLLAATGSSRKQPLQLNEMDRAILEYGADSAVKLKVRVNEGSAGDQAVDTLGFMKDYNNLARVYPRLIEDRAGVTLTKVRIAVPTEQGSPNYLIDFSEPAVRKVLEACPSAQAVAAKDAVDAAQQGAVEEEPMEQSDEDIRARQCTVTYRGATPESYSPEAVAEYQAECPGYDLPIAWQEAANVEADVGSEGTLVGTCVEKKTEAYRDEMGEDAMVRQDMLDEWEAECVAAQ